MCFQISKSGDVQILNKNVLIVSTTLQYWLKWRWTSTKEYSFDHVNINLESVLCPHTVGGDPPEDKTVAL